VSTTDGFRGTASWYSAYRPGVESEVRAALVAQVSHLPRPRALLDLGTGTGQVIEALAPSFDLTVGVDSEPEMLDEARRLLGENDQRRWLLGSAEDVALPENLHPQLITIARAFHWMDQPRVLDRAAQLIDPRGRLVVLGDSSFWTTEGVWKDIIRSTIKEFLGDKRRAGSGTYTHHNRPYDEVIAESAFSEVKKVTIPVTRRWNTASVLGYLYSTSFSSQDLYRERLVEFDELLRRRLDEFEGGGGTLEETVEFTLFVGRLA
jgi:ubiquinone/menaquinone biosynthesis C-methylase UbiE